MPPDIQAWVDESQAAFVGTLIEKHDGAAGQFGPESIYVFQVEEWVKGDAGDVIEVHSASDGAACGFEFWDPDQRIGAIIREENGELHGDLCSQVDPDVLLAATRPPTPSETGIGHLLIGGGWASTHLTVVDREGHHVTDLAPPDAVNEEGGSTVLDVCPDGDLMVQTTASDVLVWDLNTYQSVAAYRIPSGWVSDLSCRSADASSIWIITGDDVNSELVDVADGPTVLAALPGAIGRIGTDFVVAQENHEGDAIWVDPETGSTTELTDTAPNKLIAISVAPHPSQRLVAVLETTFEEAGPTTAILSIVDATGTVVESYEIPWETYAPIWLDDHRVAVKSHDWNNERTMGFIYDIDRSEVVEIDGWDMEYTIADGETLYGLSGGSVSTTTLTDHTIEDLVTLPTESAGPIVLLDDPPAVFPTEVAEAETTATTTPPLVAAGRVEEEGLDYLPWLAGAAIVSFLGMLVWLARHLRDDGPSTD
jgi:hypothetical protein